MLEKGDLGERDANVLLLCWGPNAEEGETTTTVTGDANTTVTGETGTTGTASIGQRPV